MVLNSPPSPRGVTSRRFQHKVELELGIILERHREPLAVDTGRELGFAEFREQGPPGVKFDPFDVAAAVFSPFPSEAEHISV